METGIDAFGNVDEGWFLRSRNFGKFQVELAEKAFEKDLETQNHFALGI